MKVSELLKEIKGVFIPPKKKYYFGKLVYGNPYFWPWNFNKTIISIRKLKRKTIEQYNKYIEQYPWNKDKPDAFFTNVPMCQRNKHWIITVFKESYWVEFGSPIKISSTRLGWKDKYGTPRFEFPPAFQIYFFKWQFCVFWTAPDGNDDLYYEMILWWLKSAKKDLVEAEKTWGWVDYETKKSTWSDKYLV